MAGTLAIWSTRSSRSCKYRRYGGVGSWRRLYQRPGLRFDRENSGTSERTITARLLRFTARILDHAGELRSHLSPVACSVREGKDVRQHIDAKPGQKRAGFAAY